MSLGVPAPVGAVPALGVGQDDLQGPSQPKPSCDSMKMGDITGNSSLDSVSMCSLFQLTVSGQVLNLNKCCPLMSLDSVWSLFTFREEAQLMS